MKTTRKAGRPRKGKEERKNKLSTWVSDAEAAEILPMVERDSLPVSVWVRRTLLKAVRGGKE